jgi:P-type E1-E2 ATPase
MFMQMISVISISYGKPAMLPPLTIVIVVSMVKDAYEDNERRKKDNEENDSRCTIVTSEGDLVESTWKTLKVGQVIKVKENEFLPADLLLIASTGLEGLCYVETKSLDGETNLKHKVAPK